VSGIEVLVGQADSLAAATAQRGELLSRAGVAAGLLAVLVVAVLMALDRRRELAQGASTGVGPGRTAGLWAVEVVLPAAAAGAIGVLLARATLSVAGPPGRVPAAAVAEGLRRAAAVAAVGVVVVAVVGAVATLVVERSTTRAQTRRLPWVVVLVAVAAVAVTATVTTPSASPGPVALSVPALAAAAAGGLLATLAAWACRRVVATRSSRLPRSVGAASRWLALRRLARPAGEQPVVVAVAALGLGMVLFALSAVAATRVAVADRAAVAAGAQVTAQIDGSWVLDPSAPHLPTADDVTAGKRIPVGRTPSVPDGMTLVWRTPVSIEGDFGYRDLLVAAPNALVRVATWGQGSTLADARATTDQLGAAGSAAMAAGAAAPVPVIAVAEPGFRPGDLLTISGQDWSTPVRVVASVTTFPGSSGKGTLVAAASPFFRAVPRWDPRLAPAADSLSPRPFFETWLWSSRPTPDVTSFLDSHATHPTVVTTLDQSAQQPALVAAERSLGYQVALAAFLAVTAIVAAAVYARRLVRRSRGADAMLARVGLGRRGVAWARTWEIVLVVLVALVAAVAVTALVGPLGPLLLDLDRGARPAYELHLTWVALGVTVAVALTMILTALLAGVRPMVSRHGPSAEEVVLRDDG
jgi:putative ABC transport system permease protein